MNSPDTLIEIDHVTFGYDASRSILNDVSLRFPRGKVTAILGGSGCGKTTLLRLIGGVHAASKGRVVFDGEVVNATPQGKGVLTTDDGRLAATFRNGVALAGGTFTPDSPPADSGDEGLAAKAGATLDLSDDCKNAKLFKPLWCNVRN